MFFEKYTSLFPFVFSFVFFFRFVHVFFFQRICYNIAARIIVTREIAARVIRAAISGMFDSRMIWR